MARNLARVQMLLLSPTMTERESVTFFPLKQTPEIITNSLLMANSPWKICMGSWQAIFQFQWKFKNFPINVRQTSRSEFFFKLAHQQVTWTIFLLFFLNSTPTVYRRQKIDFSRLIFRHCMRAVDFNRLFYEKISFLYDSCLPVIISIEMSGPNPLYWIIQWEPESYVAKLLCLRLL